MAEDFYLAQGYRAQALAAVERWREIQEQAEAAHQAARAACLLALKHGSPERTLAAETGVARSTLRIWQGKDQEDN